MTCFRPATPVAFGVTACGIVPCGPLLGTNALLASLCVLLRWPLPSAAFKELTTMTAEKSQQLADYMLFFFERNHLLLTNAQVREGLSVRLCDYAP